MRSTLMLLAVLWFCCRAALAAPVAGLFEATATVTDRTESARRAAARIALGKVLVKVTGDRGSMRSPATAPILQNAERFIQQYLYERATTEPQLLPGSFAADTLAVRFQFNAGMLAQALRDSDVAVWGHERPRSLIWLLLHPAGGEAALVGVEDNSPLLAVSQAQAEARGIPLTVPLLDLDERLRLSPESVQRGELASITEASARYGAEAVLVGDVRETAPGLWQAQWHLLANGAQSDWISLNEDPALLVDEAINLTADALARSYAGGNTVAADAVTVTLTQVRSTRDYARALAYLESLAPVAKLEVAGVALDRVELRLAVRGGLPSLLQTVLLGRVFLPAPDRPDVLRLIPE